MAYKENTESIVREELLSDTKERKRLYIAETESCLSFENITKVDIRKLIDHFSVNKSSQFRVVLRGLNGSKQPCRSVSMVDVTGTN